MGTTLGQSELVVCPASLASKPLWSTLVGTQWWGTCLFLFSQTNITHSSFFPGSGGWAAVSQLGNWVDLHREPAVWACRHSQLIKCWVVASTEHFCCETGFGLNALLLCLDSSDVGSERFSEQAWSSASVVWIKRHSDIQKWGGGGQMGDDDGHVSNIRSTGWGGGWRSDQLRTHESQEEAGKSWPLLPVCKPKTRMLLLQGFRNILLYDSSQPTARLFYILGFIKTENAALDLRPFPRSFNKVSRDFNMSNRVSEIYHVILSFWKAGPPILCSVGLKRKKRQDRESEISRQVHTQSGQEAICFDSLSLQVGHARSQEGSLANVKTVPWPIYSAGIC